MDGDEMDEMIPGFLLFW